MAYLKQEFGDATEPTTHALTSGPLTIGRHESCDVVVDSPAVSRFHARISSDGQAYFVEDLGSRNGTALNGRSLSRKTPLSNGDQIEVSTLPFVFLAQDALDSESGDWGFRPAVISVADVSIDPAAQTARHTVKCGDEISYEQLGRDELRDSHVLKRLSGTGEFIGENGVGSLSQLLRLTHRLKRSIHSDEILETALESLFRSFPAAECVAVITRSRTGTGLVVAAAAARQQGTTAQICLPVLHHSMEGFEAILFVDYWSKQAKAPEDQPRAIRRYVLSVPLVGGSSEAIGAIQVDTGQTGRSFGQSDLEQLAVLAQLISMALENAREVELEVACAVTERAVDNASRLKASISPLTPPNVRGFRWGHQIIAAPDIAADLVDYVTLADGRIASLLIDVPGRGAEAAGLLVCLTRQLIGALTETGSAAATLHIAELELNKRLGHVPMITSVGVMILNPRHSTVVVAVAGHCVLAAIRKGQVESLADEMVIGPPLGAGRQGCGEISLPLATADSLVMFSDGVTRLLDPLGRMLASERLLQLIRNAAGNQTSPFDVGLRVELEEYRNGSPVPDDVAFVTVQKLAGQREAAVPESSEDVPWKSVETWDAL